MIVKCPRCGKDVKWTEENRFRPFCSERCKQIDLGAWAEGSYRVVASDSETDADEPGLEPGNALNTLKH